MTTELEQLTLAAKACGHLVIGPVEGFIVQPNAEHMGGLIVRNDQGGDSAWNPRNSDGDCARMEAALQISVEWHVSHCVAWVNALAFDQIRATNYKDHNDNKNAARRAASVAVASEIGRLM